MHNSTANSSHSFQSFQDDYFGALGNHFCGIVESNYKIKSKDFKSFTTCSKALPQWVDFVIEEKVTVSLGEHSCLKSREPAP